MSSLPLVELVYQLPSMMPHNIPMKQVPCLYKWREMSERVRRRKYDEQLTLPLVMIMISGWPE